MVGIKKARRYAGGGGPKAATIVGPSSRAADAALPTPSAAGPEGGELIDEGEIGAGGSGSVRKAYDPNLRREVATKVLAPELVKQPASMRGFVEEARLMARLDHPNIVPVHDLVVEDRKAGYIVMKLVRGRTLEAIVQEAMPARNEPADQSPASLHNLMGVFLKVCDALAFAHSRQVIHCDIKPANIMVGEFGEVYLMDWGIAEDMLPRSALRASRVRRSTRGTPAYMAPEQAGTEIAVLTERTDIFGLGTVLYFILTGQAPFDADNTTRSLALAKAGRYVDVEDAAAVPPPPGLTRIVRKAMAPDPEDRYSTVMELRQQVDLLLRSDWSLPTRVFPPGANIVEEGQWADVAYIIVRGRCAVSKTVGGKLRNLRTLKPGAVFGEAGILSGDVRTATVRAIDEVTVKLVTRALFEDKLASDTWFGKFVLALADRFRELDQIVNQPGRSARPPQLSRGAPSRKALGTNLGKTVGRTVGKTFGKMRQ